MKTAGLLSVLAAVTSVVATPTKSINQAPTKRDFSNTPQIRPSGNGQSTPGRKYLDRRY